MSGAALYREAHHSFAKSFLGRMEQALRKSFSALPEGNIRTCDIKINAAHNLPLAGQDSKQKNPALMPGFRGFDNDFQDRS